MKRWMFRLLMGLSFVLVALWAANTDFDYDENLWVMRGVIALGLTPFLALVLVLPFWLFLRLVQIPLALLEVLRDGGEGSGNG